MGVESWENVGLVIQDKLNRFEHQFDSILDELKEINKAMNKKFNEHDKAIAVMNIKLVGVTTFLLALGGGAMTLVYNLIQEALKKQLGL